jgi:hypothetical protein
MCPKVNGFVMYLETALCNLPKAIKVNSIATMNEFVIALPIGHIVEFAITASFHWKFEIIIFLLRFQRYLLPIVRARIATSLLIIFSLSRYNSFVKLILFAYFHALFWLGLYVHK